ncbi:DUF1972 domain-containing protein [Arthrobacter sp. Br18]|uniref:DUF1972 domain-containing protein n=1 Tax=Arthrobacter sp. Br18 TaxID=1312954 RepID=UPI0009DCD561|nr:DUF1972 domain-containing protein [Arthrobacter sp. Br18]
MVGTRGVPARYGGFETAIEEIGQRLVSAGMEVTVYCRNTDAERPRSFLGMRLVHLPALRLKCAETLSHTALSACHLLFSRKYDAVFVFNAANAPFIPLLRFRGAPVAVHVDGLEWKRSKWGGRGRAYYRWVEKLAVRWADALIADAQGISDYYREEFGADTSLLTYGAPLLADTGSARVRELGFTANGYHLVVARFEPENHVDRIVEGYSKSTASLPLVVVGSAPYAENYSNRIAAAAKVDPRIHLIGAVWDQDVLNELYVNARTYLHGHSVGGTNPSLLRAMGAGTATIAYDVVFNREVLGSGGRFFTSSSSLVQPLLELESMPATAATLGAKLKREAGERYRWDDVAEGYRLLAEELSTGSTTRNRNASRNPRSAWTEEGSTSPVRVAGQVPTGRPSVHVLKSPFISRKSKA